ncbi:MAG: TRAP transporter substrate-binding protein DctP [Gammaproteobacteria bacterium]
MTRFGLVPGAAVALAATLTLTGQALAADYNWQCQSFWQPGTTNQKAFEQFAADVQSRSGGRIEIEALPVNAIVPPGEMLEAMAAGIIACMNGGTGYFVGKDPGFVLLSDFNAAYESPQQQTGWFWEGGGIDLARELYAQHGAYYLGPVMWGAESIPSKQPLRNIRDFNGIKMRSPEGMGAAIWRKLGVGVSTLPGTEVYTALERGKIEATDWGTLGMNDELGYSKIAAYAIYPGIHSMPMSDVSVNMSVWEGLPDDLKALLVEATKRFNENSLQMNAELDKAMVAKRDPETLIAWGSQERRELRDVAQDIWADWGGKSPMAKKIYDAHIAYMTKLGLL